jgi:hypothetical protein
MNHGTSKVETLDFAERWLTAAVEFRPAPPAFFQSLDVDMSRCKALLQALRATSGVHVTYTHMLVHAVALATQALPELHKRVYGKRRYYPEHVNLGLMVEGGMFAVPMMTILKVEQKQLLELAGEIIETAPKIRANGKNQLSFLRRWGWIVPSAFLRRRVLRWMDWVAEWHHPEELVSFVISTSPRVDQFAGFVFGSTAVIMSGAVRDKVVAVDGRAVVRPVWTLTSVVDHRVWDGHMGQTFLLKLKQVLETASFQLPDDIASASLAAAACVSQGELVGQRV